MLWHRAVVQRPQRRATCRSSSLACGRPCPGARSGSRAARRCPSSSTSASPSRSRPAIPQRARSRACASTSSSAPTSTIDAHARRRPRGALVSTTLRGARRRSRAPRRRCPRASSSTLLLERIDATARPAQRLHHASRRSSARGRTPRRRDARRAAGSPLGPLDGLPIAVKDNIDVAGVRGDAWVGLLRRPHPARGRRGRPPPARRGRRSSSARSTLHEFAYGATTDNPHYGTCRNPWDLERVPGGSSGGSGAALGADLCLAALGSDTGGSVRIPAALNNVSAMRPDLRAWSRARGTFPGQRRARHDRADGALGRATSRECSR